MSWTIFVPILPRSHPNVGQFGGTVLACDGMFTRRHPGDLDLEDDVPTIALDDRDMEELQWARLRAAAIDTAGE